MKLNPCTRDPWTRDCVDLVAPGLVELEADHLGSLEFVAVRGGIEQFPVSPASGCRSRDLGGWAADHPGRHRQHLRRRCRVLTGVDVDEHDPRPKLRVVEPPGDHP